MSCSLLKAPSVVSCKCSIISLPAEWLRAREGRGMEEGKLYGRCPGVLPLPLPTQPFQWCKLPDIVDPGDVSRPFAFPKFPVLPAFGGCAPDVNPGLVSPCAQSLLCHGPQNTRSATFSAGCLGWWLNRRNKTVRQDI